MTVDSWDDPPPLIQKLTRLGCCARVVRSGLQLIVPLLHAPHEGVCGVDRVRICGEHAYVHLSRSAVFHELIKEVPVLVRQCRPRSCARARYVAGVLGAMIGIGQTPTALDICAMQPSYDWCLLEILVRLYRHSECADPKELLAIPVISLTWWMGHDRCGRDVMPIVQILRCINERLAKDDAP